MKETVKTLGIAFFGGLIAVGGYMYISKGFSKNPPVKVLEVSKGRPMPVVKTDFKTTMVNTKGMPTDFTTASEIALDAVVHVKKSQITTYHNPYDLYFGRSGVQRKHIVGTGSGVIISSDGYIVTNNHVIKGAEEIEVTLNNKKKYIANLVGSDKQNDIALLKIDVDGALPFLSFANSDNVKVGEWVLAVGNPFNLTSTVTAGIISAKGRDLKGDSNVNAYIQTDAAVNPGNSGGALVNTRGELVGINTAITSQTGSYIGYSFAVPSNIAKKIVEDILEFGGVQEALMGVSFSKEEDVDGVKIIEVTEDSGAEKAGLEKGDVIKKINSVKITKFSDLKGQLAAKRPGEELVVVVERDGGELEKIVKLSKRNYVVITELRVILKDLDSKMKRQYNITEGAVIMENQNRALRYYGVEKGYIITKINRENVIDAVDAQQKLISALESKGPLYLEIMNLKGKIERYGFNN